MNLLGVVAVAALALLPLSAQATPITEPLVFDFEDGLQGWELRGSAQRVQTQLLGGEWAIFGDGFLDQDGDRDDGAFIVQFFEAPVLGRVSFDLLVLDGQGSVTEGGGLILFDPGPPFEVSYSFSLTWASVQGPVVAFIDNITFHPVPEPSTLALLGLAIAGLGLRKHCSGVGGAIRVVLGEVDRVCGEPGA